MLPMTKVGVTTNTYPRDIYNEDFLPNTPQAVVRALDTTADFAAKKNSSSHITKFVVGGASKVHVTVSNVRPLLENPILVGLYSLEL